MEKNLYSESELSKASENKLINIIFEPGFSTADKVTDISGRGVGMDVVRTNIDKLKGHIEIKNEFGKGSSIKLKLPLTLEIMQALITQIETEQFAIPLTSIFEIISLNKNDIKTINGKEIIQLRESILPILKLSNILGIKNELSDQKKFYIVVIGKGDQQLGIIVNKLIGKEEIVIKPIDSDLQDNRCISGATIMGDGHVSLVLDVSGLFRYVEDMDMQN